MDMYILFYGDQWYVLTRYILTTKVLHGYTNTIPWSYTSTMYVYHSMEHFNRRDEITPLGLNGYVEMVLWGQMVCSKHATYRLLKSSVYQRAPSTKELHGIVDINGIHIAPWNGIYVTACAIENLAHVKSCQLKSVPAKCLFQSMLVS
jgi:hypothetical protein